MASTQSLQRVLIMAGGTGGHVFPGLAVAAALKAQGVSVAWLGTSAGLEARLVPDAGLTLHTIQIGGVRGKGWQARFMAPFRLLSAIREAYRIIQAINPDVVLGMGGFASGPGGIASFLLRRPLVIHEQNAKAGLTNRALAFLANRVLEGFPGAFKPASKVSYVGNPVRVEIENLRSPTERENHHSASFRLLVLGGSLGAKALNEMVPSALALLDEQSRPKVLHQTGAKLFEEAKKIYESKGVSATLQPFIEDMARAYSEADMVLCRAGALTVSELCAAGLGSILIPYPFAVDDHQTANAAFLVDQGAAQCIQQSELTAARLADIVKQFASQEEKCLAMASAAYALRKVHVAETICQVLREIIKREGD